jgi:hypothetical protein
MSALAASAPSPGAPDADRERRCALCKRRGRGTLGPFLPKPIVQRGETLWVHASCADFSPLTDLKGVGAELTRGAGLACAHCRKRGATLGCAPTFCNTSWHLGCAAEAGGHFDAARHLAGVGGFFCAAHVFAPGSANAEPARGDPQRWIDALARLREEVRVRGGAGAAGGGGGGGAMGGAFLLGVGSLAGAVLGGAFKDALAASAALERAVGVASAAGSRCAVCSTGFRAAPLDLALTAGGALPLAAPRAGNPRAGDAAHISDPPLTRGEAAGGGDGGGGAADALAADAAALPASAVGALAAWHPPLRQRAAAALRAAARSGDAADGAAGGAAAYAAAGEGALAVASPPASDSEGDSDSEADGEGGGGGAAGEAARRRRLLESVLNTEAGPAIAGTDDDGSWWLAGTALRCAGCATLVHAGC